MTRRHRLTPDEIETIGRLRKRNRTRRSIAQEINCSIGSVSWACLREGFEPVKPRPIGYRLPAIIRRGGKIVRTFRPDEDAFIMAERAASPPRRICDIARALNRPPNSVYGRILTLLRIEDRRQQQEALQRAARRPTGGISQEARP